MMNNKGFSGFLNDYKAQNLANTSDTANFHWSKLREQANLLEHEYISENELLSLKKILNEQFTIRQLQLLGEALKSLISVSTSKIFEDKNAKGLMYHFFEAAEITADSVSLSTAIEIGEIFKKFVKMYDYPSATPR